MRINFKNFKNEKATYILLFLIFWSMCINFDLLFSRKFFSHELISTRTINDPSIAINLEWNRTVVNYEKSDGRDVVVDINDNVYAIGNIYNNTKGVSDIIAIKYDNLGNQLWNRTWGGDSDDYGYALDIDSLENIYIVGQTRSYGNNSIDVCLIKYSSSGNLIWNVTWGGDYDDAAFGVAVGNDNKIYVTGYTESYGVFIDSMVLKYYQSGILEWNKFWGGMDTDVANDVIIDLQGNIFITGYTSSFGAETSELFLAKFNNSGILQWNITWGGMLPDSGNSLKIDSINNLLIVGNTQNFGKGSSDIILLKLNNDGELIWNHTWGGTGYDYGYSVALDSKDNIYASGYTNSYNGNDRDVCLIKFDPLGNLIWNKFWGKDYDDLSYSIDIDSYNNVFLTGKFETSENNEELFLLKYSPLPDDFSLISLEVLPDIDGNITLAWSESLDADNYSIFLSTDYTTEIDENVTRLIDGYFNFTYKIDNLGEGDFYFIVVAYNKYGFTSSNCLKIKVQYVPHEFTLFNYTQNFNSNGCLNLTWTNSIGADNYSVYSHDKFIYDFQNKGVLISNGIPDTFFQINNLTDGDYFFVIIANNEVGQTMSNCIKVKVRRAPSSFVLTTNADQPDSDGNFELIWTRSEFSQNYSIYYSNFSFSDLNENVNILYEGFTPSFLWPTYRYQISNWQNGTYFFKVIAFNLYGNQSTNYLEVVIDIPQDEDENPIEEDRNTFRFEPEVFVLFILIGLLGILIFIRYKYKKYPRS